MVNARDRIRRSYCCQDPSNMIVGSSLFIGFAGKYRADERTRTAFLLQLRVCGQGLLRVAQLCKSRISKRFLFPHLPTVAGHCVRVRVKLGSRVRGLRVAGSCSSFAHAHQYAVYTRCSYRLRYSSGTIVAMAPHSGDLFRMLQAKFVEGE